jgi:hypothetical protein
VAIPSIRHMFVSGRDIDLSCVGDFVNYLQLETLDLKSYHPSYERASQQKRMNMISPERRAVLNAPSGKPRTSERILHSLRKQD